MGTFKGNNGEKDQHNRMGITSNPRNSQRTDRIPLPTKWFLAAHRWNWRTALRLRRQPDAHARRRQHRMAPRGHAARTRRTGLRANHPTRPPAVVHHHDVQPPKAPCHRQGAFSIWAGVHVGKDNVGKDNAAVGVHAKGAGHLAFRRSAAGPAEAPSPRPEAPSPSASQSARRALRCYRRRGRA